MIVNTTDRTTVEVEALISNLRKDVTELITDLNTDVSNMMAALNTTISNSVGTVKSIQRGVVVGGSKEAVININPVNPDKCIVLLDNSYISVSNSTAFSYLISITETVLTIGANKPADFPSKEISWQVVEFY